ncbi:glycerophosphodiester phosphodiesterase family protein [bacterium]|nr:glycerophosphodiester phosphodiesterase family protein [bacterium]
MKIRAISERKTLASFAIFFLLFLALQPVHSAKPTINELENARDLQRYIRWEEGSEKLISAHRGGPLPGFPENCIATFENSLKYGQCIIECDVRKTSDGTLVMLHDETLDRTTTGSGLLIEKSWQDAQKLRLVDNNGTLTTFTMPTLDEVLIWAKGKAVLTIDVKQPVSAQEIVAAIERNNAWGVSIVITYTHDQAKEYYSLNKNLCLSVSIRGIEEFERFKDSGIPFRNIVAFVGVHEPDPGLYPLLHENHVRTILGTMGNLDKSAQTRGINVYQNLFENGADILSTDDVPLVSEAIEKLSTLKN